MATILHISRTTTSRVVGCATVFLAALAWPALAPADDTIVAADPTAAFASAYAGVLVWDREAPQGLHHLVKSVNGVTSDAPVPPQSRPFRADLGPDKDGGPLAVYARCGKRCDIFELDIESGIERKVREISTSHDEPLAATWKGRGTCSPGTAGS